MEAITPLASPNSSRLKSGVIYDFGMNNGDDVAYYIKKGRRVVAVEANPVLCAAASERFAAAIGSGALTILNVALTDKDSNEPADFYVNRLNHVLSCFHEPPEDIRHDFDAIKVAQRTAVSIIREFGEPHYVKIDLEGFDSVVLQDLANAGIVPPYISAEAHDPRALAALILMGYTAFNLVEGRNVAEKYRCALIETDDGAEEYSFPEHSAGPFGRDIASPWIKPEDFFRLISKAGFGWRDIHATSRIAPQPFDVARLYRQSFREHLRDIIPSLARAIRKRIGVASGDAVLATTSKASG
jgi:FkbM family methyltransferase